MAFSPRKAEVEVITAILEGEHESADALARKLLRAMPGIIRGREWAVLVNRMDEASMPLLYGPFDGITDARKAAESGNMIGKAEVYRLQSVTKVQSQRVTDSAVKLQCAKCGHNPETHDFPGMGNRRCVVKKCRCKAYVSPTGAED